MNKLIFNPWKGDNYGKAPYGKLLIVGESHYTEGDIYSDSTDFTTKVVKEFIEDKIGARFFRNLGLLFNEQDRYDLWKNVAFANAIQHGLHDAKSQPQKENIGTIIPSFWMLLEELKPEKIIICSNRMWVKWMPDHDPRSARIDDLNENGKHSTVWKYTYSSGSCLAIGINHPSKFFSRPLWKPLVMKFLEYKKTS